MTIMETGQPAPGTATLHRARGWAVLEAFGGILIGHAGNHGRPGGKPTWARQPRPPCGASPPPSGGKKGSTKARRNGGPANRPKGRCLGFAPSSRRPGAPLKTWRVSQDKQRSVTAGIPSAPATATRACLSAVSSRPAQRPAEPSMTSRIRSACPLCRAYSSTRCCHIQRTDMVFSRKVKVSSSLAASSAASTARHSAR
jgi:hypothetical protein